MPQLNALLPLLVIAVAFYFLILRPTKARQAAAREVQARLAPGARVMTTAGLFGTVEALDGEHVLLEIAPGVTVRYVSAAIAKVLDEVEPGAEGTPIADRPSIIEDDAPGA